MPTRGKIKISFIKGLWLYPKIAFALFLLAGMILPVYSLQMVINIACDNHNLKNWLMAVLARAHLLDETQSDGYTLKANAETMSLYDARNQAVKSWFYPVRAGQFLDDVTDIFAHHKMQAEQNPISIQSYQFYANALSLQNDEGVRIALTEKERDILLFLYQQAGTISRKDLLDKIWGYHEGVETHTLETHIYRLRQKIEVDPATPKILCTDEDGYFLQL